MLSQADDSGGDNDFNYDFHTLLIQTFAHGQWLAARLSTEVRIRRHGNHPAHATLSKARESHPAPHLLLTHAEVRSKLACTGTGPGGL